jgi:hypothetical protein
MVLNFPDSVSKNTGISTLMKIRPMEAQLFNAGGQTGRRDETSFADEPKTKLLKST